MFLSLGFDSDTVLVFRNVLKETAAVADAAGQTCSLTFQGEWHYVRTALMRLVGEFPGAKERFVRLFEELDPMMTAPEWAQCW